jgi:hypothetical protein
VDAAFMLFLRPTWEGHSRRKIGATESTVSHRNTPGAQGHQTFWDAARLGASRAGDFMIVGSFGRYMGETAHDHGSVSAR